MRYSRRAEAGDPTPGAPEPLLPGEHSSPLNSGTITQKNAPMSMGHTDRPSNGQSQSNVGTAEINCKSESNLGVTQAAGVHGGDSKAQPGETEHQPEDGTKPATASDQQQLRLQLQPRTPHNPAQRQFADQVTDGGGDNTFTRPAVSIIIIEQATPSGTETPADASALEEMMIIQNNLQAEMQQEGLPADQPIEDKRRKPNSKERPRVQSRPPPRVLSQVEGLAKSYFETTYKSLEKEREMKAVVDGGFQIL